MSEPSSLIGCLFQHAEQSPERCAVASRDMRLSHAELAGLVVAQANRLRDERITSTSVVGIECGDDVQHLILCLATAHLGATSCTLAVFESPQQREQTAQSIGVTHIAGEQMALALTYSADDSNWADSALHPAMGAKLLFSTSGTTGEPKIVIHSDSNLVAQAPRHVVTADERFACLASIEHIFAKRHRLYCVAQGATNVFLDPTPASLISQCRSLDVTTLHLSAFQAQEFLALPDLADLQQIRLKLGGSHVSTQLRQRLQERVTKDLQCGYGTTETGAIAFTDPRDDGADGSVGHALPGIEIRVASSDEGRAEAGEHGEISIRCDGMFHGYLNRPEATEARLKDGWFHTGDTGYLDDGGRLHLCGRADDMFVFNSMNIYPQDIEAQICQYPTVVDAAVVPKRSPVHGDIPVALVVFDAATDPDLRDLNRFVRSLAGQRRPRQFTVVDQIPRNATGKILRTEAQQLLIDLGQGD